MPLSYSSQVTSTWVRAKSGPPSARVQAVTTVTGRFACQGGMGFSCRSEGSGTLAGGGRDAGQQVGQGVGRASLGAPLVDLDVAGPGAERTAIPLGGGLLVAHLEAGATVLEGEQ